MLNLNFAKKQLLSLQLELREFGLSPTDWRIIKKSRSQFMIQSILEKDFYFIGEVKTNNTKQWRYIQIAGLF